MKAVLAIPILLILALGMSLQQVKGDVEEDQAYLLEGSGFAVTEDVIKNSQIDFLINLDSKVGSTTKLVVEDGFVTLGDMEFNVADITGSVLRDGHFIRLAGTADDSLGNQVSLSAFGRLIENSEEGSVYSFTGRLSEGIFSNKIILTTKISQITNNIPTITTLGEPTPTLQEQVEEKEIVVRISPGSSSQGFDLDYISARQAATEATFEQGDDPTRARYLYPNRLTITPGTTITFQNDDTVSHSIVSAKRDTNARGIGHDFRMFADGRVATGEIPPGESRSVTITDRGFLFLVDLDYAWIRMDLVSFPEASESIVIRSENRWHQKGN
jgi:plastocyanin